ncbi:hypothetical protein [Staphylococcus phage PMBT8]|nr:hypothetical protein [Staphylococcus phage PMBT8]
MNKKKLITGLISLVILALFYTIIIISNFISCPRSIVDQIFVAVLITGVVFIMWDEYNRRF